MLLLRIRQAEVALTDGRLEEAYEIAIRPKVRLHRRGQNLIKQLADAFVLRGHQYLADGRNEHALRDGDRAEKLAGHKPAIVQLRDAAGKLLEQTATDRRRRRETLQAARRQIEQGNLSVGAKMCDDVDQTTSVMRLRQDVDLRRAKLEQALERARRTIELGQPQDAIADLLFASSLQPAGDNLAELSRKVRDLMLASIWKQLDQGRLDQVKSGLNRLSDIAAESGELDELRNIIAHCDSASNLVSQGRMAELTDELSVLRRMLPNALWLPEAIQRADAAAKAIDDLRRSPLGLPSQARATEAPRNKAATGADVARRPAVTDELGTRFLLHVDGGGGFLVLRGPRATIGGGSTNQNFDISLLAAAGLPNISIERVDEDYFLRSQLAVSVNDRPFTSKLLCDGDRIRLGSRCSIRFLLPCSASTSCVLELNGTKLARRDIRRIILMDNALVIADHSASHIQARPVSRPFVLFVNEGQLYARAMTPSPEPRIVIRPNEPICISGIHVVAKPCDALVGHPGKE